MVKGSAGLSLGFILLAALLSAGFVAAVAWSARRAGASPAGARRSALLAAAAAVAWLGFTGGTAASGVLRFDPFPPTMLPVIALTMGLAVWVGVSRLGERLATTLPLAVLVGWQGFRLPLEMLMHRAYEEGVMPVQMSYEGLNYDIVTGIGALVVAGLVATGRGSLGLVRAWNVVGTLLLLNILTVAFLSAPLPIRVFWNEPANVWITAFPYVWLPAVMVATAIAGHILVYRRLRYEAARRAGQRPGARSPGRPTVAV